MHYNSLLHKQSTYFKSDVTKPYAFRKKALNTLRSAIINYESRIEEALYLDLGKSKAEAFITEIGMVLTEIKVTLKHLKRWMKPKNIKTPLVLFKATSKLYQEPYGNTLIIAPWNYPFQLSMSPLVGAIAAGNTAIIKPSELAPHTAQIIEEMINEYFEKDYLHVINGDAETSKALLDLRWDYIFFTGSIPIGKKIMEQASKNLTPVTLELGGKSPAILDDSIDLKLAVKRIVYGKLINAGQTCIAPDYVLLKKHQLDSFIEYFNLYVKEFYGNPLESNYYPKIINSRHIERLKSYLNGEKVLVGGKVQADKFEPTLVLVEKLENPIMQEEIFGPILPIVIYEEVDSLIELLKDKEKPLAFYLFSRDKAHIQAFISSLSFGGATINDTLMHFVHPDMGFGGVGYSGMGSYHGKDSFLTFSHAKPVLYRSNWIDLPLRYFPMSKMKERILKRLLK